jgi:hypothetical protein
MKRRRHTPEQIIRKLREAERLIGGGKTIAEAANELGISEQIPQRGHTPSARRDHRRIASAATPLGSRRRSRIPNHYAGVNALMSEPLPRTRIHQRSLGVAEKRVPVTPSPLKDACG